MSLDELLSTHPQQHRVSCGPQLHIDKGSESTRPDVIFVLSDQFLDYAVGCIGIRAETRLTEAIQKFTIFLVHVFLRHRGFISDNLTVTGLDSQIL